MSHVILRTPEKLQELCLALEMGVWPLFLPGVAPRPLSPILRGLKQNSAHDVL